MGSISQSTNVEQHWGTWGTCYLILGIAIAAAAYYWVPTIGYDLENARIERRAVLGLMGITGSTSLITLGALLMTPLPRVGSYATQVKILLMAIPMVSALIIGIVAISF